MTSFVIEGGHRIEGTIRPIGNKNAALPMLSACLLTDEPVIIHNVPGIADVKVTLELMQSMALRSSGLTKKRCGFRQKIFTLRSLIRCYRKKSARVLCLPVRCWHAAGWLISLRLVAMRLVNGVWIRMSTGCESSARRFAMSAATS